MTGLGYTILDPINCAKNFLTIRRGPLNVGGPFCVAGPAQFNCYANGPLSEEFYQYIRRSERMLVILEIHWTVHCDCVLDLEHRTENTVAMKIPNDTSYKAT